MSSTRSTVKTVSVVEQSQDEQVADETSIGAAVSAAFDWLFGTVSAEEEDDTVEADELTGYTYRELASQRGGIRNVEYQEDVETAEDVYDEAFERLSDTRTRAKTDIARGVEYDLSHDGVPGEQISQRSAEEARLKRGRDVHRKDIPWRTPDGSLDEEALQSYTRIKQEQVEARLDHLELISKQAAADFAQDERGDRTFEMATSSTQTVLKVADRHGSDRVIDREELVVGSHPEDAIDPRARLGQVSPPTLGTVNKHAAQLAEDYDLSPAVISKFIAERITSDSPSVQDVIRAISTVRERLDDAPAVVSPIKTIDPDADRVSAAGTVTQLFHPHDIDSQAQVGYIDDGTGSAKFTVWKKSECDTLFHEGDEVAIKAASPGEYKGRPTLAIRHDSVVIVQEPGNGLAKASRDPAERSESTPQHRGRCPRSLTPSLGSSEPVPRPEHDRYNHREQTLFFPEHVPEWFIHRPDVESLETTSKSNLCTDGQFMYGITSRRRYDRGGVTWADKQRQKAKQAGRERRLKEKKYGKKWYNQGTQRADDDYYRWKQNKQFGADERVIHAPLPWPGHEDTGIPRLDDAVGHFDI